MRNESTATRKPGRPKKVGPKAKDAGINLTQPEIDELDQLKERLICGTRANVVRQLMAKYRDEVAA